MKKPDLLSGFSFVHFPRRSKDPAGAGLCHRRSWISFVVALFACEAARVEWAWIWVPTLPPTLWSPQALIELGIALAHAGDAGVRDAWLERLDREFPARSAALNRELTEGTMLIGRAYEENGRLHVVYDPRNPDEREEVDLARLKTRRPYPVSFMPTGLLNGLNPEEVLDLLGYVLSGGDHEHPLFKSHSAGH